MCFDALINSLESLKVIPAYIFLINFTRKNYRMLIKSIVYILRVNEWG